MDLDVMKFVESFKNKPVRHFTLSDLVTRDGHVSFSKLLKEHNHEVWQKCSCGNEEDLRIRWHCSECGKVIYKPIWP